MDFIYQEIFRSATLEEMEVPLFPPLPALPLSPASHLPPLPPQLLTLKMQVELWTPPAPPPSPPPSPPPPPAPFAPAAPFLPGVSSGSLGFTVWQTVWPATTFPAQLWRAGQADPFGRGFTIEVIHSWVLDSF